jgi:hypothetical protein
MCRAQLRDRVIVARDEDGFACLGLGDDGRQP